MQWIWDMNERKGRKTHGVMIYYLLQQAYQWSLPMPTAERMVDFPHGNRCSGLGPEPTINTDGPSETTPPSMRIFSRVVLYWQHSCAAVPIPLRKFRQAAWIHEIWLAACRKSGFQDFVSDDAINILALAMRFLSAGFWQHWKCQLWACFLMVLGYSGSSIQVFGSIQRFSTSGRCRKSDFQHLFPMAPWIFRQHTKY